MEQQQLGDKISWGLYSTLLSSVPEQQQLLQRIPPSRGSDQRNGDDILGAISLKFSFFFEHSLEGLLGNGAGRPPLLHLRGWQLKRGLKSLKFKLNSNSNWIKSLRFQG